MCARQIWHVCVKECVFTCVCVCVCAHLHQISLCRLPVLQPACGDKHMMKECVCVCVTWACCVLLAEGRGLETIGPKMSSSLLIGPAAPVFFPPASGASVIKTYLHQITVVLK